MGYPGFSKDGQSDNYLNTKGKKEGSNMSHPEFLIRFDPIFLNFDSIFEFFRKNRKNELLVKIGRFFSKRW